MSPRRKSIPLSRRAHDVARWVALHGPLLSTGAEAASLPPARAAAAASLAVLPALAFAVVGERTRLGVALPYAIVPASWGLGLAVVDASLDPEMPTSEFRVLRYIAALLVYLAAARMSAEPLEPLPSRPAGERTLRPDATRRATVRAVLVATTTATALGAAAAATFAVVGATPAERTFAVVIASTLGLTLLLAALPVAIRRERTPASGRVSGFAWLALAAVLALASVWVR